MKHSALAILLALLIAGSLTAPAAAGTTVTNQSLTTNGAITISPPIIELQLGPGLQQTTTTIKLINTTSYQLNVTVSIEDFRPQLGGTNFILAPAGSSSLITNGLARWMSLPEGPHITLQPNQTEETPVVFNNASDLTPGGHYGAVIFSSQLASATNKQIVGFNQQLVSLVFLNKLGGETYGLKLNSVHPNLTSGVPDEVDVGFSSTGNVYVTPRGYITVTDTKGKLLARGTINPTSQLIPQGMNRNFSTILQPTGATAAPGRLKLTVFYRYDGQNDYQQKVLYVRQTTVSKWLIAAAVTGLILVFLLAILWRRHRFRALSVEKRLHKRYY